MGAIAEAGQAKRGLKERGMKRRMASNIFGDVGTAIGMAVSAGKKAKTAKGEFEAGYEEMGGDVSKLEKPGILKQIGRTLMPGGHKGFFQMPEGEYRIDDRMYQAENLRTVGEYAKQLKDPTSEVSKQMILQGIDREGMMGRIKQFAPGKDVPLGQLKSELRGRQETGLATFLSDPENLKKYGKDIWAQGAGIGDIDKSRQMLTDAGWTGGKAFTSGFGSKKPKGLIGMASGQQTLSDFLGSSGVGIQRPDFLQGYTPNIQTKGETISKRDARKTEKILMKQRKNISGVDPESLRGSGLSGAAYDKLVWERQGKRGPDVPMQLEEDYLELGPEFQGPPEAEPEWGRFDEEMWERSRAERDIIDRGILEEKGYFDRSYKADPWKWRKQSPYGSVPSHEARQKYALGGRIPGKDAGDDNLVRAEDNEYILNREAAEGLEREHGKGFLDYVNFEKYPRFQTGGRKRSPGYQEGGEVGQANGLATKEEIDRYFQETEGMANIGDPYLVRGEARDLMMERNKTIGSIFTGSTETKNLRSGLEQYTDFQEQIEPGTGTAEDFSGYEEYISHNPETGRFFTERSSWEPRKQALWEQYVNSTMMDPVTVKGRRRYQEGGSVEGPYRNNVMDLYNRYGGRND